MGFLAQGWDWGRKRGRRFISLLESAEMVSARVSTNDTTITLINWSKFQGRGTARVAAIGSNEGISEGISEGTTNNNELIMTNNVYNAPDGGTHMEEKEEAPRPMYVNDPELTERKFEEARKRLKGGDS